MNTIHTPDHWKMFHYSNLGTDITYKILVSWEDSPTMGMAHRTSDTIIRIQETPSSFIITDACHDVYMCDKTKYSMTPAVQNVFNHMVEHGPHQWIREVPFEHIRSSE
jgi:hypothetical protein